MKNDKNNKNAKFNCLLEDQLTDERSSKDIKLKNIQKNQNVFEIIEDDENDFIKIQKEIIEIDSKINIIKNFMKDENEEIIENHQNFKKNKVLEKESALQIENERIEDDYNKKIDILKNDLKTEDILNKNDKLAEKNIDLKIQEKSKYFKIKKDLLTLKNKKLEENDAKTRKKIL